MRKVPHEHFIDYLQVTAMFGEANITNNKHNIVQNLIFSSVRFKDLRQALLLIIAINIGIRPIDLILVISYILT